MKFPRLADLYGFAKDALSEPNGTGSFSRVSAAAIIGSVLMWVSYVVFKTHAIPDLSGPTLFLTGGSSATYGANKVAGVVSGALQHQGTPDAPVAVKRDDLSTS